MTTEENQLSFTIDIGGEVVDNVIEIGGDLESVRVIHVGVADTNKVVVSPNKGGGVSNYKGGEVSSGSISVVAGDNNKGGVVVVSSSTTSDKVGEVFSPGRRSSRVLGVWPPQLNLLPPKKEFQYDEVEKPDDYIAKNPTPKSEEEVDNKERIVGGLNQVLAVRQKERYDVKLEKDILAWLAEKLPQFKDSILDPEKDLQQVLRSGVILCHLLNTISPNLLSNISILKIAFKQMENITMYINGCIQIGIPETEIFSTIDLYEAKDMSTVLNHLRYLKARETKATESEIALKREKITEIIKSKPREIEDASSSTVDKSWIKDDQKPVPVINHTPLNVPRRAKTINIQDTDKLPKWKRDLLQRDERRQQRMMIDAQNRKEKFEKSLAENDDETKKPANAEDRWGVNLKASAPINNRQQSNMDDIPGLNTSVRNLWQQKDEEAQLFSPKSRENARNLTVSANPRNRLSDSSVKKTLPQLIAERKKERETKEGIENEKKKEEDILFEKEKADKIASGDTFFGAGKEKGIEIWRIEKLEAIPWPESNHGIFVTGDSFLILHTIREGGPWDLFFWLGSESSQDEKGAAALKTVELDDRLGGAATQHREVQYHESDLFLSIFKGGIEYTDDGAVDSAFNVVDRDAYKTRLLHLKGSKTVRVKTVPVTYKSLNSGDVFILDTRSMIWQWNGTESSRREKLQGLQTTTRIRDSRGAKIYVDVIEEGSEPQEFWDALGDKGSITPANEVESDDQFEKKSNESSKLYHVSDASGTLEVKLMSTAPFQQSLLNPDDCHIIDVGTELFVWVGKGCTKQEKIQSMSIAENFLKSDPNRPDWVPITRIVQGAETPVFKAQFQLWKDTGNNKETQNMWGYNPSDYDAHVDRQKKIREQNQQRKIDVSSLIKNKTEKKEDFSTETEGSIKIWRVENFEAVPVKPSDYGIFFGGDTYMIYFTPENKKQPLLYYWIGKKSTKDEQGAAVLLSKEICEKYQGGGMKATHVRVTQGKEPGHFLNLFKGKFLVRFGGVASGFSNVDEEDEIDDSPYQLYHVHGTSLLDTKGVQVALKTSSLNSADSFVLNAPENQYVWYGKGCEQVEKEFADRIASFINNNDKKVEQFEEGNEPDIFWSILGGKGEYQNAPELQSEVKEARLFHCSNASGKYEVEEILNFDQDDLLLDDVYILDVFNSVMVWVGPESNEEEKLKSFEMAIDYVKQASGIDGRDPECSVIRILAGAEPPFFTRWFHGWDDTRGESDAYRVALEAIKNEENKVMDVKAALEEYKRAETAKYSYKELVRLPDQPLPNGGKGIDTGNLEKYLNETDFQMVFKMTYDEFLNTPKWKRDRLKQDALLF